MNISLEDNSIEAITGEYEALIKAYMPFKLHFVDCDNTLIEINYSNARFTDKYSFKTQVVDL